MKKTVPIVIGVLILILLFLGLISQIGKKEVGISPEVSPKLEVPVEVPVTAEVPSLKESKLVISQWESEDVSWAQVQGKITEIKDRTITLSAEEESLSIYLVEGITIGRIPQPGAKEEIIEFKDLKVGDRLIVNAVILPEGGLEGRGAVVVPR